MACTDDMMDPDWLLDSPATKNIEMTSIFSRRDVQSWRTSLEVYRDGTRRSLVPGVTRSPQETIATVLAAVANVTSVGRILLLLAYNYIARLITITTGSILGDIVTITTRPILGDIVIIKGAIR